MRSIIYFSDSQKRAIISEVQSGLIGKEEARRKYGIRGNSRILNWIRKFEESESDSPIMDYKKSDKKELLKRIKKLERQLEDEQIRSLGYSKMIDIAEDQLKISIRKKPDTKQSKK
jgi:transposase